MEEQTAGEKGLDAADQTVGENGEVATHEAEQQNQQPQESAQERNWRAANETMLSQRREIDQLSARLNQLQQESRPGNQPKQDPFNGRDPTSLAALEDISNFIQQNESKQFSKLQEKIADLEMRARDPNYMSVINQYGTNLTEAQKAAALASPSPYLAAYEMCVGSAAYYKDQMSKQQHGDAKRARDNLQKPGSASSAGVQGALMHAQDYEKMTDDQIIEMGNRYARGET